MGKLIRNQFSTTPLVVGLEPTGHYVQGGPGMCVCMYVFMCVYACNTCRYNMGECCVCMCVCMHMGWNVRVIMCREGQECVYVYVYVRMRQVYIQRPGMPCVYVCMHFVYVCMCM
jgi:hypothetical protein